MIMAEIDPAESVDARQRIPALLNERPFALPDAKEPPAPLRSVS